MKKSIKILLLTFVIMVVTIGCSKQTTFLKAMKSLEEYNSTEYSIGIDDIELGKEDVSINSMVALIKDVKISGNTLKDEKNELNVKTNMKINLLGMEIPFEVIQLENKAYMSADYVKSIEKVMFSAMGIPENEDGSYEKLKDKYIEITEFMSPEDEKKEIDIEKSTKEIQKIFTNYIKKMEKSKFSSEGKVITAKFDSKDFINLFKDMKEELIKIYPDMKEMDFDELDKVNDSFIMNLDMSINTSEKTIDYIFKIGTDDETESLKSITLKANMKFLNSEEKFKAPKKEDIMTEEEFDKIVGENMALTDEEYNYEPEPITDEEFQIFLENFKDEMKEFEMTKEEMLEYYSGVFSFTEEQIKTLEAIE